MEQSEKSFTVAFGFLLTVLVEMTKDSFAAPHRMAGELA
jgi:hypothetical protein